MKNVANNGSDKMNHSLWWGVWPRSNWVQCRETSGRAGSLQWLVQLSRCWARPSQEETPAPIFSLLQSSIGISEDGRWRGMFFPPRQCSLFTSLRQWTTPRRASRGTSLFSVVNRKISKKIVLQSCRSPLLSHQQGLWRKGCSLESKETRSMEENSLRQK